MSSFFDVISNASDNLTTLPSVHSTSSFHARSILTSGTLMPTPCRTFKVEYLYLFYGRAAYRPDPETGAVRDAQFKPTAFIFDTESIIHKLKRLFPTDSGGFSRVNGPHSNHFYKDVQIRDLELPPDIVNAKRLIRVFYKTNQRYLDFKPLCHIKIPKWAFEAHSYHRMIIDSDNRNYDDRASTIEFVFDDSILLRNARYIIVPSEFHNSEFLREAKKRFGFAVGYYRSNPKQTPDQTFEMLRSKVDIYARRYGN